MIAIIDFGAGNLRSVENALLKLGEKPLVTDSAEEIMKAEKVVFPGVGNFGSAMQALKKKKLDKTVKEVIADGKPFIGICLGMQLLLERSEESPSVDGLGILKGEVKKFQGTLKIPQIGWNELEIKKEKRIFEGINNKAFAYFIHSYYVVPKDKAVIAAETDYGIRYCSALEKDNIFACQFHPEKSGKIGLRILQNFVKTE